ncbi:hypothetical protein, partial [Bacillus cereus]|uniref:hypothetical protein n=1 Tax=Bacillus cereus TaxID=1396 RepID=UPI001C2FFC18
PFSLTFFARRLSYVLLSTYNREMLNTYYVGYIISLIKIKTVEGLSSINCFLTNIGDKTIIIRFTLA